MKITIAELEAECPKREPFELDLGGGVVLAMPHPADLPAILLLRQGHPDDASAMVREFRLILGDEGLERLLDMRGADGRELVSVGLLPAILRRYYDHFGVGPVAADRPETAEAVPGA